jgi:hypothetical protein
MNIKPISGPALEKALAEKLRELLGSISWLEGWSVQNFPTISDRGFDFLVKRPSPKGGQAELWVQCKSDPRPSLFPYAYVANEGNRKPVLVLAAPFISPRMAEVCQQAGWSWFDLAGNYHIDVPGLLSLRQAGRAPIHKRPPPAANLSTREAGRVIRALLLPDNAGVRWTQRHMAKHFGKLKEPIPEPSLGLVNKVVRHLRDEAFIEESEEGFRLRDPLKLLFAWRDVYRFDRHERRGYFTLLQGRKLYEALYRFGIHAELTTYASFSAAEFQAPHVRQPKTWLYIRDQDLAEFAEMVEAKPVDSGENVAVLIPDDDGIFYMADGGVAGDMRLACTNEVQTYVDLWHSGGRGQEAAEALLKQRLQPEWKVRGLKV